VNAVTAAVKAANEQITLQEAVELSAADPMFYGQFFFPKAIRQESAKFHPEMWKYLLSLERLIAFMIARGFAKTTIVRVFLSYIVAYAISRTILVVGKSEGAAERTVEWLQRAVDFNQKWANAYGLTRGSKWTGGEIDIYHATEGVNIRMLAIGITGSTRGINIDDYRPDLIVVDDPCDEENTATAEQRQKTSDRLFGALYNSLAPRSEAPMAKLVLLQTVLNKEDLISKATSLSSWKSLVYSCFDANGESNWPARWTTQELLQMKQDYIEQGDLSIWLREMECKVIDSTTAAFPENFIQYWEVLPEGGRTIIAVDPTPPPRDAHDIQKSNEHLDDACIMAIREYRGNFYICEVYVTKSPDPEEFINEIFRMCEAWGSREVAIETTLFARTTKTLLEKEMLLRRQWLTIYPVEDKRAKPLRFRQVIKPLYTLRKIYLHATQGGLIEQLTSYPAVNHDDMIDALAIGLEKLSGWNAGDDDGDTYEGDFAPVPEESDIKETWRACP